MAKAPVKIALLGAESTGKTQLSEDLATHLRGQGKSVIVVPEYLREWCVRENRTPRPEEQMPIAQEQERRVDIAAASADVVISDTTALMVAIYSAMLFEDGSLYRFALERQRGYDLTRLTGLDLPWVADGLQRDGPHVREPVDVLIRSALARADVPYRVVVGNALGLDVEVHGSILTRERNAPRVDFAPVSDAAPGPGQQRNREWPRPVAAAG